jgi:hypothetical protein
MVDALAFARATMLVNIKACVYLSNFEAGPYSPFWKKIRPKIISTCRHVAGSSYQIDERYGPSDGLCALCSQLEDTPVIILSSHVCSWSEKPRDKSGQIGVSRHIYSFQMHAPLNQNFPQGNARFYDFSPESDANITVWSSAYIFKLAAVNDL